MASSFDETPARDIADMVYAEVLALYLTIKDTPGILKVRRAEMRQGEVQAEPIDFLIDVELKAKRVTDYDPYAKAQWDRVMQHPDEYMAIDAYTRFQLGNEFNLSRLGVDGDYRMLFFKMKNLKQEKQETTDGIFE